MGQFVKFRKWVYTFELREMSFLIDFKLFWGLNCPLTSEIKTSFILCISTYYV